MALHTQTTKVLSIKGTDRLALMRVGRKAFAMRLQILSLNPVGGEPPNPLERTLSEPVEPGLGP